MVCFALCFGSVLYIQHKQPHTTKHRSQECKHSLLPPLAPPSVATKNKSITYESVHGLYRSERSTQHTHDEIKEKTCATSYCSYLQRMLNIENWKTNRNKRHVKQSKSSSSRRIKRIHAQQQAATTSNARRKGSVAHLLG